MQNDQYGDFPPEVSHWLQGLALLAFTSPGIDLPACYINCRPVVKPLGHGHVAEMINAGLAGPGLLHLGCLEGAIGARAGTGLSRAFPHPCLLGYQGVTVYSGSGSPAHG